MTGAADDSSTTEFEMELRGQRVRVRAELKHGPRAIEVYTELFDAASGARLDWRLMRDELATVCRQAGEVSKRRQQQ